MKAPKADAPQPTAKSSVKNFGREDLTAVYHAAKDLIYSKNLLLLTNLEEENGIKRLTICNLWRIERHGNVILTFEYSLSKLMWVDSPSFEDWPFIPIWPINSTRSLDFWRGIIWKAINKALEAVGYNKLPKYTTDIPESAFEENKDWYKNEKFKDNRFLLELKDMRARRDRYLGS